MLPVVSFFALKIHLEPIMFAPGGASSSLHVPAIFSVVSSSWIAFSQSAQSGLLLASASVQGSRASVLAVSATRTCSKSPELSSPSSSVNQMPPASSGSSSTLGSCTLVGMVGSDGHVEETPRPDSRLCMVRDGLHRQAVGLVWSSESKSVTCSLPSVVVLDCSPLSCGVAPKYTLRSVCTLREVLK